MSELHELPGPKAQLESAGESPAAVKSARRSNFTIVIFALLVPLPCLALNYARATYPVPKNSFEHYALQQPLSINGRTFPAGSLIRGVEENGLVRFAVTYVDKQTDHPIKLSGVIARDKVDLR